MACVQRYPSNPRLSLQMSLFCATAFFDYGSVSAKVFNYDYSISSSCNTIIRSALNSTIVHTNSKFPSEICSQSIEADTCTVLAPVYPFKYRTCASYCAGFPGLKCEAAAFSYDNLCLAGRNISCDAPMASQSNLLCTCGVDSVARANAIAPSPDRPLTSTCSALVATTSFSTPQICQQDYVANTCQVYAVTNSQTCNAYCESYGLRCLRGAGRINFEYYC